MQHSASYLQLYSGRGNLYTITGYSSSTKAFLHAIRQKGVKEPG